MMLGAQATFDTTSARAYIAFHNIGDVLSFTAHDAFPAHEVHYKTAILELQQAILKFGGHAKAGPCVQL